jgi:pyrroline-5-carboxylate reductase
VSRQGMTVWCCTPNMTTAQKESIGSLLECLGRQQFVEEESYLDMATGETPREYT